MTDKSPKEIAYLLSLEGINYNRVDQIYGLRPGTASKTAGYPHADGEAAISKALNLSPSSIWPSRYDSDGNRLQPQPSRNYKAQPRARHCQKADAK